MLAPPSSSANRSSRHHSISSTPHHATLHIDRNRDLPFPVGSRTQYVFCLMVTARLIKILPHSHPHPICRRGRKRPIECSHGWGGYSRSCRRYVCRRRLGGPCATGPHYVCWWSGCWTVCGLCGLCRAAYVFCTGDGWVDRGVWVLEGGMAGGVGVEV